MRTLCRRRVVTDSFSTKQRPHFYKCQPALALPLLPHGMSVLQSTAVYVLQFAYGFSPLSKKSRARPQPEICLNDLQVANHRPQSCLQVFIQRLPNPSIHHRRLGLPQ